MNTCYYCGHRGTDVNQFAHIHVGGQGEVSYRACDDVDSCITRRDHECLETEGMPQVRR